MISLTVKLSTLAVPPLCVACGAPAGPDTVDAGASDWSGKRSVSLKFPLCAACGSAHEAGRTTFGFKRKMAKKDPALVERYDRVMHAVKIRDYHPTAFRSSTSDTITVQVADPTFAHLFALVNGLEPPAGSVPFDPTAFETSEPAAPPEPIAETVPPRPDV